MKRRSQGLSKKDLVKRKERKIPSETSLDIYLDSIRTKMDKVEAYYKDKVLPAHLELLRNDTWNTISNGPNGPRP